MDARRLTAVLRVAVLGKLPASGVMDRRRLRSWRSLRRSAPSSSFQSLVSAGTFAREWARELLVEAGAVPPAAAEEDAAPAAAPPAAAAAAAAAEAAAVG